MWMIIAPLLFLFLLFIVPKVPIPFTVIGMTILFTGVIIGFILADVIDVHNTHVQNRQRTLRTIEDLQTLVPITKEQVQRLITAFLSKGGEYDVLQAIEEKITVYPPIRQEQIKRLLLTMETLIQQRRDLTLIIPTSIWYMVLIVVSLSSLTIIISNDLPMELCLIGLLLLWVPIIIIYYLYEGLEAETMRLLLAYINGSAFPQ